MQYRPRPSVSSSNDNPTRGQSVPEAHAGACSPQRLSKSRYVSGLKCPKLLWWSTYERSAPELQVDSSLQTIFDRGHRVGELARTYVPGGVLIDLPHWQIDERVAATARALASRVPVIYEASFLADGVYAAFDILERVRGGYVLSEVKATLGVKDEHLPDVAVQLHVAQHAGLAVRRVELMHLNRECNYPDLTNLFVREDVTRRAKASLRDMPAAISRLKATLAGPLPDVAPGEHCTKPHRCAFFDRCHGALPAHHVSTLYKIRHSNQQALEARGITTLDQLPPEELPPGPARRQVESVHSGLPVIEKGLRQALKLFKPPLAFLDFETINPPVPMWKGCAPYQQMPVQMSCHRVDQRGRPTHYEWLATSSKDSRAALAHAVLEACDGARSVVAYNSSFEHGVLLNLAEALPALRDELEALADRLVDLLPVVRDHVYHPEFNASFSLKAVLPALVPELSYESLSIQDGADASRKLERLLLAPDESDLEEQTEVRRALLEYCRLDTYGLVRLYERLGVMAA